MYTNLYVYIYIPFHLTKCCIVIPKVTFNAELQNALYRGQWLQLATSSCYSFYSQTNRIVLLFVGQLLQLCTCD